MEDFPKRDLDDYFCRFTFGQFITLILLEVVILFLVFYLGARYGRDLIGGRDEILQDPTTQGAPKSVDDIVGRPSVDYTYPEVLTGSGNHPSAIRVKPSGVSAEDYARRPPEVETPEPAAAEPTEPVAEKTTVKFPQEVPSEPVAAEAETPEPTPPPAPPVTVKPKGDFAIQLGSYPTPTEASQVLARWKKKGYAAYQVIADIPGRGQWYRVRLGGFPNRVDAKKYLDRFQAKEKVEAIIVSTKN